MIAVSRPVCVGEIVIFVRYATAIVRLPICVINCPMRTCLNDSPVNGIQQMKWKSFYKARKTVLRSQYNHKLKDEESRAESLDDVAFVLRKWGKKM